MHEDLKRAVELLNKGRQYASFFEWPDKSAKELGVVEELLPTLNTAAHLGWHLTLYLQARPSRLCLRECRRWLCGN